MVFIEYTLFNSRTFSSERNTIPISSNFLFPPSPSPLATPNLPSASMALPTLDISFKWNHTVQGSA